MSRKKVRHKKSKMEQKKTYEYVAVLSPAEEGGFNVSFPALPGCVTFGRNLPHAKKMAREALALWLEELVAQKKRDPSARAGIVTIKTTVGKA